MGRPESRLASATNRPIRPVAPTIKTGLLMVGFELDMVAIGCWEVSALYIQTCCSSSFCMGSENIYWVGVGGECYIMHGRVKKRGVKYIW